MTEDEIRAYLLEEHKDSDPEFVAGFITCIIALIREGRCAATMVDGELYLVDLDLPDN
jgi:hypothetical protein